MTTSWVVALTLLPLLVLAAACCFGYWVRPGGDDWCFLPEVRDGGFSAILERFYYRDNGRIANAVLVGAYATFGIAGHQWFGLVSGVLILGLLWAVTTSVLRGADLRAPRGVTLLMASMVMAVFLFATPNTYKTFYWPAASVSHTLPPVLACAAAIPLLRARSRRGRYAAVATVFAAGVIMGTLSEETSVVALVVLGGVLLVSRPLLAEHRRTYARIWCAAGITGTGIGTLVLLTSPGSESRRERHSTDGMFAPDALLGSLGGFGTALGTIAPTWQYLGVVAAGVLLGLAVTGPDGRVPHGPAHLPLLACVGLFAFLISGYVCSLIAYPAFGSSVGTSTRLWNDYLMLYVVLLAGAGALLGNAARRSARFTGAATVAGTGVYALVCVVLAVSVADLAGTMRTHARDWDHQDRWLSAQAAAGAQVLPYKPLPIARMTEPFRFHVGTWPASCVADYHRIDRITETTKLP